jgi:MFS transporter, DHA2 family, multidrug resistance protein
VFLINIPFGIMAVVGLFFTLTNVRDKDPPKFDLVGFAALAIAIGSFQLMLDRGQMLDWFDSTEVWVEATAAVTSFYIFVVHTATARRPFVSPKLFTDANYMLGLVYGLAVGGVIYGVMSLQAPLLANLLNYPILMVGLIMAPRGVGTLIGMPFGGYLMDRFDARWIVLAGMALCVWSLLLLSQSNLAMDSWLMIEAGVIQGFGVALLFVSITTATFATVDPAMRNQATALNSLSRNMGGSMWIAILQVTTIRSEASIHARLTEGVRPDNPAMGLRAPDFDFGAVASLARMDGEVGRQALMAAYVQSFNILLTMCIVLMPFIYFFGRGRRKTE